MEELEIKLYVGSIINWNVPCKWNDFKGKFNIKFERGNEKYQVNAINKFHFEKSEYRYFLYERSCIIIYKPKNIRIYISLPKDYCIELKEISDDNKKVIDNIINKLYSFEIIDTKKDYSFVINLFNILNALNHDVSFIIDHLYSICSNDFKSKLWFENYITNYHSDVQNIYSNLNIGFKLSLWIWDIYGSLDYLEFSKHFHALDPEGKILFNKKVKEHAINEQIRSFINQIPNAILLLSNLNINQYKCKWRNIYFKQQKIQIFLSQNLSTNDYSCSFSRDELNLLTQEYFTNRRLDDIIVTVNHNNCIECIEGLDSIEKQINLVEVKKNDSIASRKKVSNEQVIRLIHNVGERNKCIRFLNEQNPRYNVVLIQELVTKEDGGLRKDASFLYCLPDNTDNIYMIWESAEFEKSKATHIFKCKTFEVENSIDIIKAFLESTIHSRTMLNSPNSYDIGQKSELNYFGRVIHDSKEYGIWEQRMKNTLPFLK